MSCDYQQGSVKCTNCNEGYIEHKWTKSTGSRGDTMTFHHRECNRCGYQPKPVGCLTAIGIILALTTACVASLIW